MDKPFVFGVAAAGGNFTDRQDEAKRLLANFLSGVNTVLISPRRWGKTSLVRKVGKMAEGKGVKVVFLDVFSYRTEAEFYNGFVAAVIKQTSSKWEEWVENTKSFLSRVRPTISMGTDPSTDFSVGLELDEKREAVEEILSLPEKIALKKGVRVVVCIDEFQQVMDFEEPVTFQKRLRSVWQHQSAVSYCLFGSKKHLMSVLFEKRNLPFYKFGDVLYLPKIGTASWVDYIVGRFESSGKEIDESYARLICDMVDNHSSYVQQLSWLIWLRAENRVDNESFCLGLDDLLNQNSMLFQRDVEYLTGYQLNFLRAVCDGLNSEFTKKDVIAKYNFGTSANVTRIKKALADKEIVDVSSQKVTLVDPVFGLWFKREIQHKQILPFSLTKDEK
jgi:hypothetical protein